MPIQSMTGFGKAQSPFNGQILTVEIKTLNHRYLDIQLRIPGNWAELEEPLRQKIRKFLSRGRVTLFANITEPNSNLTPRIPRLNQNALSAYRQIIEQLKSQLSETAREFRSDLNIDELLKLPGIIVLEDPFNDPKALAEPLLQTAEEALKNLKQMRIKEGQILQKEIEKFLQNIGEIAKKIEELAVSLPEKQFQKLKRNLQNYNLPADLNSDRLLQELAIFAEKSDISEEIQRLYSHVQQFKSLLNSNQPVGRKMDFLCQEFLREANTIASKAGDKNITPHIIELKSIIEKIREQVQNIE